MRESSGLETNLEEIFRDFSNVVIIIRDNYNFNYLNHIGVSLLGYKQKDILEMSFIELITPDSLENCIDSIRTLRKTGFSQPFSVNLLKKNGEILSLELSGIKLDDGRFFFTGKNLSLERLSKEKLDFLEELNKNILNSIGEGIIVLDTKGCIVNINEFVEKNFHWVKSDLIGKNVFELFPDLKEEGLLESFVKIVEEGTYERKTNIVGIRPDGRKFVLNIRGYPLKRSGKTTGVVTIIDDITKGSEISERIKRSAVLREKVQRITAALIPLNSVENIVECLLDGLTCEFGYERIAIFLAQNDKKTPDLLKLISSINSPNEINKARKKISEETLKGKGLTMKVFKTGEPKIFNNAYKEKNSLRIFSDTLSEMIVPIKIRNVPIGIITIDSRRPDAFDDIDLKFVEILANTVAISLGKTKLSEKLLKKLHSLSILFETSKILQTNQKITTIFSKVLKHLGQKFPDYVTLVMGFNHKKSNILASFNASLRIKAILSTITEKTKQSLLKKMINENPLIMDSLQENNSTLSRELRKQKIRTIYVFPFFSRNKVAGSFFLLGYKKSLLDKDHISFLIALASQMSSRIEG